MGTTRRNLYSGWIASKILVALCLFFFVSNGWSACIETTVSGSMWGASFGHPSQYCCGNSSYQSMCNIPSGTYCGNPPSACSGKAVYRGSMIEATCYNSWGATTARCSQNITCCDTQAEADSVAHETTCKNNPLDPSCVTQGALDMAAADSSCRAVGGVSHYTVSVDKKSATGYCDLCQVDANGFPTNEEAKRIINEARWKCCQNNGYIPDNKVTCRSVPKIESIDQVKVNGVNFNPSSMEWDCDLGVPMDLGTMMPQGCADVDNEGGPGGGSGSEGDTSAGIGTDSANQGDWEYNYYPILDSIRDTLNQMLDVVRMGVKALQDMDGKGGDTIINNIEIPRDTIVNEITVSAPNVYINDSAYKSQLNSIDSILAATRLFLDAYDSTQQNRWVAVCGDKDNCPNIDSLRASIQGYQDSVLEWIARGDSERVVFVDSLFALFSYIGYGQDTIKNYMAAWDSLLATGIDTAGLGVGAEDTIAKYFFSNQFSKAFLDSLTHAWGLDTLSAAFDSSLSFGYCVGDSCLPCTDDECTGGNGSGSFGEGLGGGDSLVLDWGDSLKRAVKREEDSLPSKWTDLFDEAKRYTYFGSFDSTFYANIGAKIPNSNTCPDACFKVDGSVKILGITIADSLDWGLCKPLPAEVFGNMNAFDFIKLLARLLTVISCLFIIMWEVSSKRGRIGL